LWVCSALAQQKQFESFKITWQDSQYYASSSGIAKRSDRNMENLRHRTVRQDKNNRTVERLLQLPVNSAAGEKSAGREMNFGRGPGKTRRSYAE
jgi:hypothetical protein